MVRRGNGLPPWTGHRDAYGTAGAAGATPLGGGSPGLKQTHKDSRAVRGDGKVEGERLGNQGQEHVGEHEELMGSARGGLRQPHEAPPTSATAVWAQRPVHGGACSAQGFRGAGNVCLQGMSVCRPAALPLLPAPCPPAPSSEHAEPTARPVVISAHPMQKCRGSRVLWGRGWGNGANGQRWAKVSVQLFVWKNNTIINKR